jgi:hypothetical protein
MRSTLLSVLVVACHAASVSKREGSMTPTQLHDLAQSVQHLTDAQKECIADGKYNASQFNEDITLLPYLATISHSLGQAGSFVEIGALDGLMYSNTLMFERCLGWHGLLIEGNPMNAEKLLQCGRTQVAFETKAVCNGTGNVTMTLGGFAVAGEIDQMNPKELDMFNETEHYNETVQVPCREMGAMMNDAGMTDSADMTTYLSLDVEGAEAKVHSSLRSRHATCRGGSEHLH